MYGLSPRPNHSFESLYAGEYNPTDASLNVQTTMRRCYGVKFYKCGPGHCTQNEYSELCAYA